MVFFIRIVVVMVSLHSHRNSHKDSYYTLRYWVKVTTVCLFLSSLVPKVQQFFQGCNSAWLGTALRV